MTVRTRAIGGALVALTLLLSGCGGDDGESSSGDTADATVPDDEAAPLLDPEEVESTPAPDDATVLVDGDTSTTTAPGPPVDGFVDAVVDDVADQAEVEQPSDEGEPLTVTTFNGWTFQHPARFDQVNGHGNGDRTGISAFSYDPSAGRITSLVRFMSADEDANALQALEQWVTETEPYCPALADVDPLADSELYTTTSYAGYMLTLPECQEGGPTVTVVAVAAVDGRLSGTFTAYISDPRDVAALGTAIATLGPAA